MSDKPQNWIEEFLQDWDLEFGTTVKILEAVPEAQRDFRPHPKSRSARELSWHIVIEEDINVHGLIRGELGFPEEPPAPDTMAEILWRYRSRHDHLADQIRQHVRVEDRYRLIPSFGHQMPVGMILNKVLLAHLIHHRAQLTVYLRLMDAFVPGCYGPSGDEQHG